MARDNSLEDLCTNLVEALNSVAMADELPAYLHTKARDMNALGKHEALAKSIPEDRFQRLFDSKNKARLSRDLDVVTKHDLISQLIKMKPVLERVTDSSFRLMVERLTSVYELAFYLSDLTEEVLSREAQLAAEIGGDFKVRSLK
ncbi:MAG: hypothetical protein OXU45_00525 [Candidatus Melainabacteria bacterium]|nr:hypothetical protein [Candidatus Melainabacteria bacterium]